MYFLIIFSSLSEDVPGVPTSVDIKEESSRHLIIVWKSSKDSNAPITRYIVNYQPIGIKMNYKGKRIINNISDFDDKL